MSTPGPARAQVEVDNVAYKIPRNSLIEANQSGLIAETLIDITPRLPIPQNKVRFSRPLLRPARQGASADGCMRLAAVGAVGPHLRRGGHDCL